MIPIFSNPMNRILANQFPYDVKIKTIYWTKDTKFRKIFENTLEATVIVIRDENGEFINTIFIPEAKDGNPYCRLVAERGILIKEYHCLFFVINSLLLE